MEAVNGNFLLSIGATHPWNIAGVGVDATVARDYRLRHAVALVGVTAQDERGFHGAFALDAAAVRAQLESLPAQVVATHVGLLFDAANVYEVARFLRRTAGAPLVIDTVFADTFGAQFVDERTFRAFCDAMLPLAAILTPNLGEASRLLLREITDVDAMVAAARELQSRGPSAVLLKGGHLAGDPVDVLATTESVEFFSDVRLANEMRGTGDTLAAALACELALGKSLLEAVSGARDYVRAKIRLS